MKATLVLENGMVFHGEQIGALEERMFHLVCNSSMTGYQEIFTDPAYAGQGIVMTYPLIGNYGVCDGDDESSRPWLEALVVRHLSDRGSNFRCTDTLDAYLKQHKIPGICGVDTRALTRLLRREGTMNAMLTFAESFSVEEAVKALGQMRPTQLVERVTRSTPEKRDGGGRKIALLDLGVTNSVLQALQERAFQVTVFPAHTKAADILNGEFDGLILSGGPGDPRDLGPIIQEAAAIYQAQIPVFAMGLGHQVMALAAGMKVKKLPYGHRSSSHPVREMESGIIAITAQNHGFAVDADSVAPDVATISHMHVNDKTVEGLTYRRPHLFSVQFTPETQTVSFGIKNQYDRFRDELDAINGIQPGHTAERGE